MIAESKDLCSGCGACINICPRGCIKFIQDNEGFNYPLIDSRECIICHLCENVCPYIRVARDSKKPITIYAAFSKRDEIRHSSSSGGVFTELAEDIIEYGGYVFGAQFDHNWDVKHSGTNIIEDLSRYRGSKYVQSNTLMTFREAKQLLEKDQLVLYSGTPCQISGLKNFLGKDYDNLLTVDLVCHGVASPKVWQMFLKKQAGETDISSIEFRAKDSGWRNYRLKIMSDSGQSIYNQNVNESLYMRGFLNELYLRPSCYNCIAKNFRSGSDLTIGDYWWIHNVRPDIDDNKGCSLIYVNSSKGLEYLEKTNVFKVETFTDDAVRNAYLYSGAISSSAKPHPKRKEFFDLLDEDHLEQLIVKYTRPGFRNIIIGKLKYFLRKIPFIMSIYNKIKYVKWNHKR